MARCEARRRQAAAPAGSQAAVVNKETGTQRVRMCVLLPNHYKRGENSENALVSLHRNAMVLTPSSQ